MIRASRSPVTRAEKIGLMIALVLAVALMAPMRHSLNDDAFVHLQYARHVASGRGLVFNPGEPVNGCTSPLWVALIADGMALGFDGLATARALGFAATLASVALFLQLLRQTLRSPELRAAGTVAWAGHAWLLQWSVSGLETSLAVALTLAGFVALVEGQQWGARPLRTGTLWAMAALTRPEAVLLLFLWGIALLLETENRDGVRRFFAGLLPPAVLYGGWLLFTRLYYGTFWPQPFSSEATDGAASATRLDGLWRSLRIAGATDGVLAVVMIMALIFGGARLWRRAPNWHHGLPWAWLVAVQVLYVARDVPVLSRHLLTSLPVLAWLAWRAVDQWWVGEVDDAVRRRRAAALGIALAGLVLVQNLAVVRTIVLPEIRSSTAGLAGTLVEWGRWFGTHSEPDDVIATPEIGAIGYLSDRRVLDLGGRITPEVAHELGRQTQAELIARFGFAQAARADYLVDRGPRPYSLVDSSVYGACLVPLGHAEAPEGAGVERQGVVYSFYKVDWAAYDSLRLWPRATARPGVATARP